jgi:glycosyltransferase involved in cell wall biosynthesis
MKLLQIGKYFPPTYGGIETVTHDLHNFLNRSGVQADVLCVSEGKSRCELLFGGSIFRCRVNFKLKSAPISISFIMKFFAIARNYDVIHVHLPNPMAEVLLLFYSRPERIYVHWHADIDVQKYKYFAMIYKVLSKRLIKKAKMVIVPSNAHRENSYFKDIMAVKSVIVPFIYNLESNDKKGLDEGNFVYLDNKFVVLAVGRLIYYKGFEYLIEAAVMLPIDCIVVVVGCGPLEGALKKKVFDLGLIGKVVLLGSVSQARLNKLYDLCNVFCLPSIYRGEMYGIVQLEAMSHGKPVINTRIHGSAVHEVSLHDITGLTVPIMNPQAIYEAILYLKENREVLSRMGNAARNRILSFHSPGEVVNKLMAIYRSS